MAEGERTPIVLAHSPSAYPPIDSSPSRLTFTTKTLALFLQFKRSIRKEYVGLITLMLFFTHHREISRQTLPGRATGRIYIRADPG